MTNNNELREALDRMLKEGEWVDNDTIILLQDASIHAAIKAGVPMGAIDMAYTILCAVHGFLFFLPGAKLSGVETPTNLADLFGTQTAGATQEEKDKLNAILKDLKIDL